MPNDLSLIRAVFGANKPGSGSWHAIIRDAGPAFRFTQCGLWLLLSPMSFRGARKREPGIHNPCCGVRIPDRRFASSGMTVVLEVYTAPSSFTQRLLPYGVLSSCHQAHRGASSGDRPEAEHGAALRAGFVTPLPGGSGAPPAGHYDPAAQDARRTRRKCQSAVCEAVRPELESLSLSNAAVKRREARRSALLAGGPLSQRGPAQP